MSLDLLKKSTKTVGRGPGKDVTAYWPTRWPLGIGGLATQPCSSMSALPTPQHPNVHCGNRFKDTPRLSRCGDLGAAWVSEPQEDLSSRRCSRQVGGDCAPQHPRQTSEGSWGAASSSASVALGNLSSWETPQGLNLTNSGDKLRKSLKNINQGTKLLSVHVKTAAWKESHWGRNKRKRSYR